MPGGAETNASGLPFEKLTDNVPHLLAQGFEKSEYYLRKDDTFFISQGNLKKFFSDKFDIDLFRKPDEAYLIQGEDYYTLKIIEKKAQKQDGSVDLKLCTAKWFIEEYQEILGPEFRVEYAFVVCDWLKERYLSETGKWPTMRTLHQRHGTRVFFGEDSDYFDKLNEWVNASK